MSLKEYASFGNVELDLSVGVKFECVDKFSYLGDLKGEGRTNLAVIARVRCARKYLR